MLHRLGLPTPGPTQISIWKSLQHANVLELLGASSASSDPPWFFVSPYYKNGSLVTYLKSLPTLETADVLKVILEIAQGMEYLHCRGVLHGDLKVRSSEETTRTDVSERRVLSAG